MKRITLFCIVAITLSLAVHAEVNQQEIATLRGGQPLASDSTNPPALDNAENTDIKRAREYPMQPPTIPHKIDNYQVDKNANKCLSCHARTRTEDSQAPMVSVTHYMDRDGNFLADVSARRYFCTQCHVTQVDRKPLVNNTFEDVHNLVIQERGGK